MVELSCGEFRILAPFHHEGVGLPSHHVDLGDEQSVDVPAATKKFAVKVGVPDPLQSSIIWCQGSGSGSGCLPY